MVLLQKNTSGLQISGLFGVNESFFCNGWTLKSRGLNIIKVYIFTNVKSSARWIPGQFFSKCWLGIQSSLIMWHWHFGVFFFFCYQPHRGERRGKKTWWIITHVGMENIPTAFIHILLVSRVTWLTLLQERLENEFAGIFHIHSLGFFNRQIPRTAPLPLLLQFLICLWPHRSSHALCWDRP